ncbi:profilin [Elysia marginata]|uniref:Profilin n=1 Tax=Elysia marginata TaxID=1093978 RepID=A0AAV4GT06_9GAST|nr:profilin [Elysia marginata]
MSAWDAYITNMKARGLQICGIFGLDGSVWAKATELQATQQEIVNIVNGIKTNNFANGIYLNGIKYTLIGCGTGYATAKCRTAQNDAEKYLLHAAMGKTCLVLGGISGAGERSATKFVEDIRDYLANSGY